MERVSEGVSEVNGSSNEKREDQREREGINSCHRQPKHTLDRVRPEVTTTSRISDNKESYEGDHSCQE